jgi:hypothetical protein
LNRSALVYRLVPFDDIGQRQREVEHLAGIDLARQHKVHQMGKEAPDGRRTAKHADLCKEERLAVELHAMRHADIADH